MINRIIAGLFFCAFLVLAGGSHAAASSPVVISELQTTGCREYRLIDPTKCAIDEANQEFIELFNTSTSDVDVTDWRVEYLTAAHNGGSTPTRVITELEGKILARSHVLVSFENYLQHADSYFGTASSTGYLAKSGGHVRLVDSSGSVTDLLSWGTATPIASWPKVGEIGGGYSAKRIFPEDPLYSANLPFVSSLGGTPEAGGLQPWRCEGVVLSEIAPNPSGADATQEFIELYNPTTEAVALRGCSLRLNNESSTFAFTNQILEAGQYLAVSDAESGITLPNSAGATVWLLSAGVEQSTQYPANMPEGATWAYINSTWQLTTMATANQANILKRVVEVDQEPGGGQTPLPCPAGKYRHPTTHRCRTIQVLSPTLKACRPDQERNPETQRCRSKPTTTLLAACKAGQTRNPATNRCRSTASAASAVLKPCQAGQERNPETNRCRKVVNNEAKASYKVEKTVAPPTVPMGWIVAGTVGAGAVSYGVYEWRREIWQLLSKLRAKVGGGSTG